MERPAGWGRLRLWPPLEEEKESAPPKPSAPNVPREAAMNVQPGSVQQGSVELGNVELGNDAAVDKEPVVVGPLQPKRHADEADSPSPPSKRLSRSATNEDAATSLVRKSTASTTQHEIITIDDDDEDHREVEPRTEKGDEGVKNEDESINKPPPKHAKPVDVRALLKKPHKFTKTVDIRALLKKPQKHVPTSPSTLEQVETMERYRAWVQVGRGLRAFFRSTGDRAVNVANGSRRASVATAAGGGDDGGGGDQLPDPPRGEAQALQAVDWPYQVAHLASNFNPSNISFTYQEGFGKCECLAPCRVHTCRNACLGLFCAETTCPFKGKCGNGLVELDGLRIMRVIGTDQMTLITRKAIGRGVVVGEYVGELSLVRLDNEAENTNEGYRLYMHRDDKHKRNERICINALNCGGRMRFINHSCEPCACFMEMSYGYKRVVVVVTTRPVRADEELTVYYGDKLWFDCTCTICRAAEVEL